MSHVASNFGSTSYAFTTISRLVYCSTTCYSEHTSSPPFISQEVRFEVLCLEAKILQNRHIGTRQKRKRRTHHPFLQLWIMRFSQRVTKRKWHEQGTRWLYLLRDLSQQRNRDCRDTSIFKRTLNQSHGLIAHWSNRRQQHHLNTIHHQFPCYLRCRCLNQFTRSDN